MPEAHQLVEISTWRGDSRDPLLHQVLRNLSLYWSDLGLPRFPPAHGAAGTRTIRDAGPHDRHVARVFTLLGLRVWRSVDSASTGVSWYTERWALSVVVAVIGDRTVSPKRRRARLPVALRGLYQDPRSDHARALRTAAALGGGVNDLLGLANGGAR